MTFRKVGNSDKLITFQSNDKKKVSNLDKSITFQPNDF